MMWPSKTAALDRKETDRESKTDAIEEYTTSDQWAWIVQFNVSKYYKE